MKKAIILILVAAAFAAPCIYDAASTEPSPLAGLLAVSQSVAAPGEPDPTTQYFSFNGGGKS